MAAGLPTRLESPSPVSFPGRKLFKKNGIVNEFQFTSSCDAVHCRLNL
jgi:hypothetical protein